MASRIYRVDWNWSVVVRGDKRHGPVSLLTIVLVGVVIFAVFSCVANASDKDRPKVDIDNSPVATSGDVTGSVDSNISVSNPIDITNSPTNNLGANQSVTVLPGGSTFTGGSPTYKSTSKALGLSNSLGDVDINDCVISNQYGTPIFSKQGSRFNAWCMAHQFTAWGWVDEAADLYCQIPDLAERFKRVDRKGYFETCVVAYVMLIRDRQKADVEIVETPPAAYWQDMRDRDAEEYEDRYAAQQEEIEFVKEELAAIKDKPAPVRTKTVREEFKYSVEQRAEVAAIFGNKDES